MNFRTRQENFAPHTHTPHLRTSAVAATTLEPISTQNRTCRSLPKSQIRFSKLKKNNSNNKVYQMTYNFFFFVSRAHGTHINVLKGVYVDAEKKGVQMEIRAIIS